MKKQQARDALNYHVLKICHIERLSLYQSIGLFDSQLNDCSNTLCMPAGHPQQAGVQDAAQDCGEEDEDRGEAGRVL